MFQEFSGIIWMNDPFLNQCMAEIYRQDSLTGLLNRNAYDSDVEQLRSADNGAVVCVYADMIGLHEVNNHLGHKQGNRMLC